jgi:hypothetical protein
MPRISRHARCSPTSRRAVDRGTGFKSQVTCTFTGRLGVSVDDVFAAARKQRTSGPIESR